ncbi:MAG: tryptophan--tRNA ligase [Myxococcales bacterium]|nr:tryptophan--tRNA ligase [Myxococcales bacterium]MDD9965156.1 tryptophan--tRNA ligase [Myxococcales bacterium]
MKTARKTMLSAVQPTNPITLGNYVGAVRRWPQYQSDYDMVFFGVDMHAITLRQDPAQLREQTYRLMATLIAVGLDPDACTLFVQSHVPQHAELGWVLTCHAYMGELNRMTQFKDKSGKAGANIPVGLFAYPCLMAADILLYDAHRVPVGADQKQHVELTRDIAVRMNNAYGGDLFVVPELFLPTIGARIMSLQDPTKKMSKSDPNPKSTVFLTDTNKQIEKKIKGAVTDSGSEVTYQDDKPGVRNLIDLQCALTGQSPDSVLPQYVGKQYGHLKQDTAAVVVEAVAPVRDEVARLMADKGSLDAVLKKGADRARERAARTLARVYDRLGFVPPRSG